MRERTRLFRERGRGLLAAASRHGPAMLPHALGGALMAHVGAFGTHTVPALIRFPYFTGLGLAGGLIAAAAAAAAHRHRWLAARPLARLAAETATVTALLTPLVWILAAWLLDGATSPLRMIALAGQVAPAALLFAPFTLLTSPSSRRAEEPGPPAVELSPLRAALPPGLRAAAIHAVEAQDHYLRIHTEHGSALVAMRLADAIAALGGADGSRTHRSWWVARAAIRGAKRGRGRAVLTLGGGLTAPVSRTYAPLLRAAGWFEGLPRVA